MENGTTLLLGLYGLAVQRVQREPDGTRVVHVVTDDETASACPSCGAFSTSVKGWRCTTPREIPYGDKRIRLRWHKRRFRCVHQECPRGSFTEQVDQVPARARITARCRIAMAVMVGDENRSVVEVAAEHRVSWPTAHRAVVAYGTRVLTEPEPLAVLGIDETRRGKPRWEKDPETGRWVRTDRWHTGLCATRRCSCRMEVRDRPSSSS